MIRSSIGGERGKRKKVWKLEMGGFDVFFLRKTKTDKSLELPIELNSGFLETPIKSIERFTFDLNRHAIEIGQVCVVEARYAFKIWKTFRLFIFEEKSVKAPGIWTQISHAVRGPGTW